MLRSRKFRRRLFVRLYRIYERRMHVYVCMYMFHAIVNSPLLRPSTITVAVAAAFCGNRTMCAITSDAFAIFYT